MKYFDTTSHEWKMVVFDAWSAAKGGGLFVCVGKEGRSGVGQESGHAAHPLFYGG